MANHKRLSEGSLSEEEIGSALATKGFELTGYQKGFEIVSEELILEILTNPIISRSLSAIPYLLIAQPIDYDYLISNAEKRGLVNKLGYMVDIAFLISKGDEEKRRELRNVSKSLEGVMDNGEYYLREVFEWEKPFLKKRASMTERKWHIYTHNKIDTYRKNFDLYYEERDKERGPHRISIKS